MHEAQLNDETMFVTLTYDDEHLPTDGSLVPDHFTLFMKKLRWHASERRRNPETGRMKRYYKPIKFYHCGEYGDRFERPHYHACIFGHTFPDKKYFRREGEHDLWTSEELDTLWGHGHCLIGSVTYQSAGYVARYITKLITGKRAPEHYLRESNTGLVTEVHPEYATMSRRPGLASEWYEEFEDDVYPWDEVIVNGHPKRPPRYYDKKYQEQHPDLWVDLQLRREADAKRRAKEHTPARLLARETVTKAKLNLTKRTYENGQP